MFRLRFDGVDRSLGARGEDRYIIETNAKIFAEGLYPYSSGRFLQDLDDDEDEWEDDKLQICHISVAIMQTSRAMNHHESIWGICDVESQELAAIDRALFTKHSELRPEFEGLVQYDFGDIRYINEIFLEKTYCGYGIGLLAIDGLIISLPSMEMDCSMLRSASIDSKAADDLAGSIAASGWLSNHYRLMGFEV